jgi:hypothetical protein
MRSVFISYSRDDQTAAQLIAKYLSDAGLSVYFDYQGVVSGDSWSDQLGSALRAADAVVVLLSSNSRRSTYVEDELQTALESKKLVVPVLLDEGAKQNWLWPLVATRQAFKLDLQSGELDRQLQDVTRALSLRPTLDVPPFSRKTGEVPLSSPVWSSNWRTIVVAVVSALLGALATWLLH